MTLGVESRRDDISLHMAFGISERIGGNMKSEIVNQPELVSPVAYARLKGFSLSWVYSLLWLGTLPATKVDGKWRIEAAALPVRPKRRNSEIESA